MRESLLFSITMFVGAVFIFTVDMDIVQFITFVLFFIASLFYGISVGGSDD